MTPQPSPTTRQRRGRLIAKFLRRPLPQQLYGVWLLGLILVVLVTAGGVLGYQLIVKSRQKVTAEYAITGVISGMQQQLGAALRHRDRDLQNVIELYAQRGLAPTPSRAQGPMALALRLNGIAIVRADGQADAMGQPLGAHQLSVAAAALAEHQRQDSTHLRVSGPTQDPKTGAWALQLSRRLTAEDGRFLGMVMGDFALDEVEHYYSQSRFLKDSVAILFSKEGRILLETTDAGSLYNGRVNPLPLVWEDSGAGQVGQADKADSGIFAGELTGSDGVERFYVWRKVPNYPLFVMKGISVESIADLTRPVRLTFIALTVLVSGVILIATGWLHLYLQQVNVTLKGRQLAEQARRDNAARLKLALIGSDSAEWELQLPEARLYVSQRLADLLALSQGDSYLDQAQWQPLIHPEDLDTLQNTLARAIRQAGEGAGAVVRVRNGSGSYNWLAVNGRASQHNSQGQVTTVNGLARDITDQQRASEKVRDRTAQLDAIFRLSPDGYVSFDEHHNVKFVNPAFVTMTGWDRSSLKGLSEVDFSSRLGQLCTAERPLRSLADLRHTIAQADDIPSEVIELAGTPRRILRVSLQSSQAPTVSQILYLRDVTHETIVEDMKTEFLATAAHELRTPMASIVGFAEILCTHPLPPADQLEFAQIIWRQSLHLAGILDELLDLSRIEARGGKGLLFETLDLRTQLDEAIHAFGLPKGRDAPAVLLPPLLCRADRGKVRQVLDNALSNAYKFSGPGTAVSISAAEPTQHPDSGRALVGLVIRDAGIGMTSEQLSRVYERFYRADKTGGVPGNGLGLSITREIMGLLNGQISISSAPQQGTAVTLLFPVADAPSVALPALAPAAPPTVA